MAAVLIAGAGDVGIRAGLVLAEAGHDVTALRRNAAKVPAPLQPLGADLCNPAELRAIPNTISHIVYAAAADGSSDEQYERAYVTGLRNVLAHARDTGSSIGRVVFISSTAVYGQSGGEWVDESSPTTPSGFSGTRTLEAEALLASSGFDHCILRCGGIYGPGRTRLIDTVRAGIASFDPAAPIYTNRIHVDDVARAAAFLLFHPAPGRVVLGVDEEPAPLGEVLTWLASALGAPAPAERPSEPARARRSASNKRVSSARLRQLGFRLRYPTYREGYAELLQASLSPGD